MSDVDHGRDYDHHTSLRAGQTDDYEDLGEEESGVRAPVSIIFGVILLAAFVGVGWVSFQQGVKYGMQRQQATPMTVDRNRTAERVRPDEPGGAAQPAERDVYSSLDGQPADAPVALLSREEDIEPLPEASSDSSTPGLRSTDTDRGRGGQEANDMIDVPLPSTNLRQQRPATREVQQAPAQQQPQTQQSNQVASSQPVGAGISDPNGGFVVQIASVPSNQAASSSWARLQNRHPDLLSGYQEDIQRVDRNGNTFFRLRIGYFSSRGDAQTLCNNLKSRRQDCFVASR